MGGGGGRGKLSVYTCRDCAVFSHTDKCWKWPYGLPRQPLRGERMVMPMAGRALGFPQFAVTSWGLPNALSPEGTDLFCPQNSAPSPQKILKYLPWKLSINLNKWLTMVLSICQSCLKLKANKQLQGITWKMWNTNNFARFNVLTAQWPIALSVIPTSVLSFSSPSFGSAIPGNSPWPQGRADSDAAACVACSRLPMTPRSVKWGW